jgi:hypothetical protein
MSADASVFARTLCLARSAKATGEIQNRDPELLYTLCDSYCHPGKVQDANQR